MLVDYVDQNSPRDKRRTPISDLVPRLHHCDRPQASAPTGLGYPADTTPAPPCTAGLTSTAELFSDRPAYPVGAKKLNSRLLAGKSWVNCDHQQGKPIAVGAAK